MISIIERFLAPIGGATKPLRDMSLSRTAGLHKVVKNKKEDMQRKMVGLEPKKRKSP